MNTIIDLYNRFMNLELVGKIAVTLITVVISFGAFTITDLVTGHTQHEEVVVVDKVYKPSYYTTGTRTDANGNVSTYSQYHSEEFILVVRQWDDTFSKEVSSDYYGQAEVGYPITLPFRYGGITGKRY